MDFSLSKSSVSGITDIFETSVSQNVDSDITLPEFTDDIESVLNCGVTPIIESAAVTDGRVTVEGKAEIRLVYAAKDSSLRSFESFVPFSRFVETGEARSEDCLSVRAETQYANCRLVNPRRFDVHGNISINICVQRVETAEIVTSSQSPDIQLLKNEVTLHNTSAAAEKSYTLSEVLEINSDLPGAAQIIYISAVPEIEETRLITGKALVKGSTEINIYYTADDKIGAVYNASFILPISQIVEMENCHEDLEAISSAVTSGIEYSVRADSSGKIRLIDTQINQRVRVEVFSEEKIDLITDAYSTEYECENVFIPVETKRISERFSETCLCTGTFNPNGKKISEVFSVIIKDISCSNRKLDNNLIISGKARVALIAGNDSGEKCYLEKQLDFELKKPISSPFIKCFVNAVARGSSYNINSSGSVDIKAEIKIDAVVFEVNQRNLITDIKTDGQKKKNATKAALTLYYPDSGETIWEIAKRYNVSARRIAEENSLENGQIPSDTMLILPRN